MTLLSPTRVVIAGVNPSWVMTQSIHKHGNIHESGFDVAAARADLRDWLKRKRVRKRLANCCHETRWGLGGRPVGERHE